MFGANHKLQFTRGVFSTPSSQQTSVDPSELELERFTRLLSMYVSLRSRYLAVIEECINIFDQDMVMMPSACTLAHDTRSKTPTLSTASSPSLRSRTPVTVPMTPPNLSTNPGGNVKVVVRVRNFLPRGQLSMNCQKVAANNLQKSTEAQNV